MPFFGSLDEFRNISILNITSRSFFIFVFSFLLTILLLVWLAVWMSRMFFHKRNTGLFIHSFIDSSIHHPFIDFFIHSLFAYSFIFKFNFSFIICSFQGSISWRWIHFSICIYLQEPPGIPPPPDSWNNCFAPGVKYEIFSG